MIIGGDNVWGVTVGVAGFVGMRKAVGCKRSGVNGSKKLSYPHICCGH